ncbi:MAG: hypothetical protein JWP92_114 [Caulobacter sp.]|nr:hypothetical protein [Caulobacter sp.]
MVEVAGERAPLRHFYAVGQPDRARAEWAAIDHALLIGQVAMSPVDGQEPVQALGEIAAHRMPGLGLKPGQVKALGDRWPRRWLPLR